MFVSRNAPHGLHKGGPRFPLLREDAPAFRRDLVKPTASLVGLFDPCPLDPPTLLEAVEQRIERIDMERQLPTGPRVDQLTQLVAVSGPRVEERQDEQLGGAALQLAVERARG
jgi:hypothetical protein